MFADYDKTRIPENHEESSIAAETKALEDSLDELQRSVDGLAELQRNSTFFTSNIGQDGNPLRYSDDGDEELISKSEMETLNEDITEFEKIKSVGGLKT